MAEYQVTTPMTAPWYEDPAGMGASMEHPLHHPFSAKFSEGVDAPLTAALHFPSSISVYDDDESECR